MNLINANLPIYEQIVLIIENKILDGELSEDDKVYSKMQLATAFNVNPMTALKALNILVDRSIIYVKRGLGMFVEKDAKSKILEYRKTAFYEQAIQQFTLEAKQLEIDLELLIKKVRDEYER